MISHPCDIIVDGIVTDEYVTYASPLWKELNATMDGDVFTKYADYPRECLCDMYSNELEMFLLFVKYSEGII